MLKVKNNDIYLSRGENTTLPITICNGDGTPFVFPANSNKSFSLKVFASGSSYIRFYTPISCKSISMEFDKVVSNGELITTWQGGTSAPSAFSGQAVTVKFDDAVFLLSIYCGDAVLQRAVISLPNGYSITLHNQEIDISTLVFTVRDNEYGRVVLQKILNMHSAITQNRKTDYTFGGWCKFNTNEILHVDKLEDIAEVLYAKYNLGIHCLAESGGKYYHLIIDKTGMLSVELYEFSISIPITHADTAKLESKGYTYDLIAYQGIADDSIFDDGCDTLGYKDIYWKRELITPHNFTIGDSHNA